MPASMRWTEIDRRALTVGLGATLIAPAPMPAGAGPGGLAWTGARDDAGRDRLVGLDRAGRPQVDFALPGRAHHVAIRPDRRRAAAPARRPGDWLAVVDLAATRMALLPAAPKRHFYGHGVFDMAGRLLYTAENDLDSLDGVIGIHDAQAGFARLGEVAAGGIGPHQIALGPDGRSLIVAIGGIATHPDYGREKLNLPDMRPALVRLDPRTGARERAALRPDWHQLGLRHIAVAGRAVVAGAQDEATRDRPVPLGFLWQGDDLDALGAPPEGWGAWRGYVGSVAASQDGRLAALTAPRAGRAGIWDIATRAWVAGIEAPDICGAAPRGASGFLFSTGRGRLWLADADPPRPHGRPQAWAFDNHLSA